MSFDVNAANKIFANPDIVNEIKAHLSSDQDLVNIFTKAGCTITAEDAQDLRNYLMGLNKLSEDQLEVSGGKMNIENGVHDVFKGAGQIIGSTARGIGSIAVGTGKGVGKTVWGLVQIPASLVRDIGKGMYDGITNK